ncbi:MAG: hypothetical protein JW801_04255 [Bacteroidales bacterium]|nr:hypothetical protein [Bacteroidales bacterium]
MRKKLHIALSLVVLLTLWSCGEEPVEYAEGYPSKLAGNWIAFEFQGAELSGRVLDPYEIATALDPNRTDALILDKLYNADVRVRADISDTAFSVRMGDQLELVSTNNYGIKYISAKGYVTTNPVLITLIYDVATLFFEDMSFYEADIEDVMLIRAGFYDDYQSVIDTVLILGYRKTGFENVSF